MHLLSQVDKAHPDVLTVMLQLFDEVFAQSTVGKKMVAVHLITIPCEPNTA